MKLLNVLASLAITAIMTAAVLGIGFLRASDAVINDEGFLTGISINGTDVSGMALEEASAILKAAEEKYLDTAAITVRCAEETRTFTARELGATSDIESVILRAYAVGRAGAPMDRLDIALAMNAGAGETFTSALRYERGRVRDAVAPFADSVYLEAQNAAASYDLTARVFTYTPERDGRYVDGDELTDIVWQRLQAGFSEAEAVATPIKAECTEDMLKRATARLSSVKTKLPADEGRRHNIALAAEAVNGCVVLPGRAYSLNALTGERTEEKGYIRVQVQSQGDEGGGVNQLAGTLYRASLLADMRVVQRRRLAAPASYLPLGFDAALEWSDKDLQCANGGAWPLYIAAYTEGGDLVVEVYGAPRGDGLTVKLVNEVVETIKPPEPQLVYDAALPLGKRVVEIQERNGYNVNTYRQYLRGDAVEETVLLASDHYPAVRGRVREGTYTAPGDDK